MRRGYLLTAVLCVSLALWFSRSGAQEAPPRARVAAPSWTYRVVLLTELAKKGQTPADQAAAIESRFNDLGNDGWELCEEFYGTVVFKRPKR